MSDEIKRIKVQVDLDFAQVTTLLVGAFEGGSNYWIDHTAWGDRLCQHHVESPYADQRLGACYSDVMAWAAERGKQFEVLVEDNDGAKRFITPESLAHGAIVMARDYPRHYRAMALENDDAETSDVYLQCVLFGEVVYG
jgi:hypothetical protein